MLLINDHRTFRRSGPSREVQYLSASFCASAEQGVTESSRDLEQRTFICHATITFHILCVVHARIVRTDVDAAAAACSCLLMQKPQLD
jgi:hypothetical protein